MILIIGYGNTLRGDDGIGQHIARRLELTLYREEVEILACHQLTPELVEPVSGARRVIFVDAAEDGPPGEIRCYEIEPDAATGAFTHNVSPASLLAAAYDLYGVRPEGVVVSITGVQFTYGDGLSAQVEAVVPAAIERIYGLIAAPHQDITCQRPHGAFSEAKHVSS